MAVDAAARADAPGRRGWAVRPLLVKAHRWISIAVGLVIALIGLSGCLMVWQAELDAALNPDWFGAPRPGDIRGACQAAAMPVEQTLEVLARAAPDARPAIVLAPTTADAAWQVWERRDPSTGHRREYFVDPACGLLLGQRERGAWTLDARHAMPTLYEFHTRLLSGEAGETVVGAMGLLLGALLLSGVWLAWPKRASRQAWRRALSISKGAAAPRWWSDAHRAAGLWSLPLGLLIAITGAALVFDEPVRRGVGLLLPLEAPARDASAADTPAGPPLRLDELALRAQAALPSARWTRITLPQSPAGPVEVRLLQQGEPRVDTGNTRLRLATDGRVLSTRDPLRGAAGNRVLDWRFPLHSAEAFGVPARMLWSAYGLLPSLLFGSGLWLWWRRRRLAAARARASPRAETAV